ncbi:hypothetical protein [Bosea lathyri]|uniref:Uncharacterized protein n=1 Tax=Bosea lathyri TaxID=1036778 RepID=A0A1H6ASE8_9HYPH|nr:hypothetical protein [Bosea lathyri]SEG51431.1 hypothetical protein SAMN04488115_106100 [Bosea lathyri]
MENASPHELFPHVRIVMGMIIGLGIARMLTGIAGFIQHPGRHRVSLLHMLWVGSILLELVLFWWWEFGLSRLPSWSFAVYLFLISYSIVLYLLSALLFPDNISEYEGYEDFFINRRRWFFGLMAASFVLDVFDTLIKGMERWSQLSGDYVVQVPIGLLLCLVACVFAQRSVQLSVAALHIAYQAYWVGRIVYTMQ